MAVCATTREQDDAKPDLRGGVAPSFGLRLKEVEKGTSFLRQRKKMQMREWPSPGPVEKREEQFKRHEVVIES